MPHEKNVRINLEGMDNHVFNNVWFDIGDGSSIGCNAEGKDPSALGGIDPLDPAGSLRGADGAWDLGVYEAVDGE